MRALTVKRPWATLIAKGLKTIENRSWKPPVAIVDGEIFAIHSGCGLDRRAYTGGSPVIPDDPGPRGAIVALATVVDVVDASDSPWFVGPLGWVLEVVELDEPIPVKGALGLWSVPADVEQRILSIL